VYNNYSIRLSFLRRYLCDRVLSRR